MKQQRLNKTEWLLSLIRDGKTMTLEQQLELTVRLSVPSIVAQISFIIMQYIDAAMVGNLGAEAAASIGIVSTTTWLFSGICTACTAGFTVQVAQHIGAGEYSRARSVLRQALVATLIFGLVLASVGAAISGYLPIWLGGDEAINKDASIYFLIFSLSLPLLQLNSLAGGMLRCSGNMRMPSMFNVLMCALDVVFNFLLIFPDREVDILGFVVEVPGAGLGVKGAALGTCLAELVVAGIMAWYLLMRSKELALNKERNDFRLTKNVIKKALWIGTPMGGEHFIICLAQIFITVIVAKLGVNAIAANSFAITAESLCYMPGYGIAEAATTLVGQSIGAKRKQLTHSFARITVVMGMVVMGVMGVIMYVTAPLMIGVMTTDPNILDLGVMALRVEAFAEPMFAASIVAYGAFVGAGDTLMPCLMIFTSIWGVRLTLAAILAPIMGLKGVWLAMCIELCFRGLIFLYRLVKCNWMKRV